MRLGSLIVILTSLVWVLEAHANSGFKVCDSSYEAGYKDLQYAPWASATFPKSGAGVVYILGAPWCPHCKRAYNLASSTSLPADFRYIGMDPYDSTDFGKIADGVKHGSKGLKRTYKSGSSPNLAEVEINYLAEGALFSANAIRLRFEPIIKKQNIENRKRPDRATWGSPVVIGIFDGQYVPFLGLPKLELMANDVVPHSSIEATKRNYINVLPDMKEPSIRIIEVIQSVTQIYAYPSTQSNSMCTERNTRLNVVGEMEIDGQSWLKVKAYTVKNGNSSYWRDIHGYIQLN